MRTPLAGLSSVASRIPDFEAKLNFLKAPASYGSPHLTVECIETHMSWVFLVGDRVYKLKKPVHFPFLDFSTLEAREFFCREEVRLNSRLAAGIYLEVVALQWEGGTFKLVSGTQRPLGGQTADWLVAMRRLPRQRMLHHLIKSRQLTTADVDTLIDLLGRFYSTAAPATLSADQYLSGLQDEHARNSEVLLKPQFHLHDAVRATNEIARALALCKGLLTERVTHHRIVEGHGDLRPDHVCLLQPPVVIDCLEFNPALRQVDPFDELAYLGLECDMAGAPWVGPQLMAGIARQLGERPPEPLMHFYTAHRAMLRARLAMAHLLDAQPRLPDKWPPLAQRYLMRALMACRAIGVRNVVNAAMPHETP